MNTHCPKYIEELYPKSAYRWQDWLAFLNEAKKHFDSFSNAWTWFDGVLGEVGSAVSCGLTTNTSTKIKRPFPWCDVYRSIGDCASSIGLSFEMSNSDIKDLCHISD